MNEPHYWWMAALCLLPAVAFGLAFMEAWRNEDRE